MDEYQKLLLDKKIAGNSIRVLEKRLEKRLEAALIGLGVSNIHLVTVSLSDKGHTKSTYMNCEIERNNTDWIGFATWAHLVLLVMNLLDLENSNVSIRYQHGANVECVVGFELSIGELEDAEHRARASAAGES